MGILSTNWHCICEFGDDVGKGREVRILSLLNTSLIVRAVCKERAQGHGDGTDSGLLLTAATFQPVLRKCLDFLLGKTGVTLTPSRDSVNAAFYSSRPGVLLFSPPHT